MSDRRRDRRCWSLPLTQFFQNFDIRLHAVVADHHNAPTPKKDPDRFWHSTASEAPALTPCPSPLLRVQKKTRTESQGTHRPYKLARPYSCSINICLHGQDHHAHHRQHRHRQQAGAASLIHNAKQGATLGKRSLLFTLSLYPLVPVLDERTHSKYLLHSFSSRRQPSLLLQW